MYIRFCLGVNNVGKKHNGGYFIILNVILKVILRLGGGVAGGLQKKTMRIILTIS